MAASGGSGYLNERASTGSTGGSTKSERAASRAAQLAAARATQRNALALEAAGAPAAGPANPALEANPLDLGLPLLPGEVDPGVGPRAAGAPHPALDADESMGSPGSRGAAAGAPPPPPPPLRGALHAQAPLPPPGAHPALPHTAVAGSKRTRFSDQGAGGAGAPSAAAAAAALPVSCALHSTRSFSQAILPPSLSPCPFAVAATAA